MDNKQIEQRLQDMSDAHHAALAAILRGNDSNQRAMAEMKRAMNSMNLAIEEMNQGFNENRIVIQAALQANEAAAEAMRLWREGRS